MLIYHTIGDDTLTVVFGAEAEKCDYGVAQSPVWWEIKNSAVWIESISFFDSEFSTREFEDKFGSATINFIYSSLVDRLPDEVDEWDLDIN